MINVYSLHYDIKILSYFVPLVMVILAKLMQRKVKDSQKKMLTW